MPTRTLVSQVSLAALIVACMPTPPAPPAPRSAMDVTASFAKTWEAAIDVFAARNIQIKTLDRSSGLIVAEPMRVSRADGLNFADCGSSPMAIPYYPTDATWNVLVRGDSTRATVKATVRFLSITTGTGATTVDCSSKGVWETDLEQRLKAMAEAKKP